MLELNNISLDALEATCSCMVDVSTECDHEMHMNDAEQHICHMPIFHDWRQSCAAYCSINMTMAIATVVAERIEFALLRTGHDVKRMQSPAG